MKNKNGSFFSGGLFVENLKRFWQISAAGFLIYFMSGPILVFTSRENGAIKNYVVSDVLGPNLFFLVAGCAMSVAAAVMVFSYLQKGSSTGIMHSMPFTRKSLFTTSYLSGLFIACLPMILTALVLVIGKCPVMQYEYDPVSGQSGLVQNDDIYTYGAVARVLGGNLIAIMFSYTISVLAGILSGNSIVHFLTACALNVLVPAYYVLTNFFADNFIYGYVDNLSLRAVSFMHPVFSFENGGGGPFSMEGKDKAIYLIAYIAVIAVVFLASYALYTIRQLERSGDSYVFPVWGQIVAVLLVIGFGGLFGLLLSHVFGLAAYILSGLVTFLIAEMIIQKRVNIFDKESLRSFVICAAALTIFVGGFNFDILGIERRLPRSGSVENVEFSVSRSGYDSLVVSDPENIDNLVALNKSIIDDFAGDSDAGYVYETAMVPDEDTVSIPQAYIRFTYELKNGGSFAREYYIPLNYLIGQQSFKEVAASDEAKFDILDFASMSPEKIDMTVEFDQYTENGVYSNYCYVENYQLSSETKKKILERLAAEYADYDMTDLISNRLEAERESDKFGNRYRNGMIRIEYKDLKAVPDKNVRDYSSRLDSWSPYDVYARALQEGSVGVEYEVTIEFNSISQQAYKDITELAKKDYEQYLLLNLPSSGAGEAKGRLDGTGIEFDASEIAKYAVDEPVPFSEINAAYHAAEDADGKL